MVKYLYVSPVGTSLLRNFVFSNEYSDLLEKYSDYNPRTWFRLSPDDPLNRIPNGFLCNPPSEITDALRNFIAKDPRRASAEVNGIYSILELFYHSPSDVEILLIGTSTCNSRLCMDIVSEYLRSKGFKIETVELKALRSVEEFEEGIIELLDKVIPRIREFKEKNKYVYINATPGFKPETTFLVLASILAGADSIVYIHEAFHQPITLPIPPITLDYEKIMEINKLYKRDKCLETNIVNEYLGEQITQHYIDMGILRPTQDKTGICIRKWFKKLIEKYL